MTDQDSTGRVCTRCKQFKAFEHFYRSRRPRHNGRYLYDSHCRACKNTDRRRRAAEARAKKVPTYRPKPEFGLDRDSIEFKFFCRVPAAGIIYKIFKG